MTRKRRRLIAVSAGMLLLAAATGLVLNAFRDSLVFFYGPRSEEHTSELQSH